MGNVIQASDLTVAQIQDTNGVIIYDENSTWDGNPIEWEVIGKDQDGQGTITVQTKNTLTGFAWDSENTSGDSNRQAYGANRVDSLLHQWLNSDSVNWYSVQHNNQYPSSSTVDLFSSNGMDSAIGSGFLTNLSSGFKSNLVIVTKKITPTVSGDPSSFTGEVFCLSCAEVCPATPIARYIPEDGYFTYQRFLTDYRTKLNKDDDWYLRSPYVVENDNETSTLFCVYPDEFLQHSAANNATTSVAPACVLSSDISLEEDANGKYKILLSDPPTPTHEDEYLDYDGVVEIANRTERKFRFSEMPTPSASWFGKSIQYIGATTVNEPIYNHNYFYECKTKEVDSQTVYYWDVAQPTIKPITNAQIDAWWNGTGGN